jgi:hypothetical protein
MPNQLPIPDPDLPEERRQIAESIADLYYTMDTIAESANELISGEAVDAFKGAWNESKLSMRQLVSDIIPDLVTGPPGPGNTREPISTEFPLPSQQFITITDLQQHHLTGKVGKLKRATLARLKDRFFMFWNFLPRTEEAREKAREAAVEYLDFGAIFVSSIPGHEQVEELLSLGKKLIEFRKTIGLLMRPF